MRKIAVVTGTRAEYGLLYWIIKGIHEDPGLQLQLIVTGMHLMPEFGMTVKVIKADGFPVAAKVEMPLSSDTEKAIATSMGIGMVGFAKAYEKLKPDILLVLGDRFEILSAVSAAVPFRIPVAHIHGGETTEGAMDELFRHAITKMSHIHFPTTKEYADRIIQMGENPENVFCYGAPGLDNISRLNRHEKEELANELQIPPDKKLGSVTFHPVTLEDNTAEAQIEELLQALKKITDIYWVFTMSNADTGGRVIMQKTADFLLGNPEAGMSFSSLGQIRYLSLLKHAVVMVGNSSSGLIEAPSFELPVVNIGDRQKGRVRAKNIIDVPDCVNGKIAAAVKKALSRGFRESLKGLESPYGNGDASPKILDILKNVPLSRIIKKHFFDIKTDK
ncbi:MAG TPA: UDP-N-acetylglucosamine 2-epimerase (hydrolyzing) [Nitrospirae bacterium]|nr:UDP-N-acetylglucosamine 2-epimerase (hydrolyzing) [Nitrospirota bacterium]